MAPIVRGYRDLLQKLDGLTSESRARFGPAVQCGVGCALCCRGLFDIGVLDALALHAAWRAAPAAVRDDVAARSEALLVQIAAAAPAWTYPFFVGEDDAAVDRVLDQIGLVACPVLGTDEGCRFYESRPFYCRVHGLKLRDERGAADIDTDCEKNFPAPPPRAQWPAFDFSAWFAAEGALIAHQGLDPDVRLLIPAVTTPRFTPYYTRWTGLR